MLLVILLHIYFVSFTDKPLTSTPALSPRAVEQRVKWAIPTDGLDYPVSAAYLDSLRARGVKIHHTSRWFNGATVEMSEEQAAEIARLPFLSGMEMTRKSDNPATPARAPKWLRADEPTDSYTDGQLATYNLLPLHNLGFEGQGILMAVCDGAFHNANTMPCFRREQELGHFDFTDDADSFYGSTGNHGTECLSAISGIAEGFSGRILPDAERGIRNREPERDG